MILNITPDHLDRHGTFENYALAKERIFAAQDASDFVVLNADNPRTAEAAARSHAPVYWFSAKHEVSAGAWAQSGNVVYRSSARGGDRNGHAAQQDFAEGRAQRGKRAGGGVRGAAGRRVSSVIARAIEKFHAVEHRLEFVATINGVDFYNDSKATNVDATAKAVAAFPGGIHLILGGKDKGSDYTPLAPLLRERVRAVYTIGAAAAKIESQLRGVVPIHACTTLANAVSAAARAARPGDVVLLAPACSSFDQFENYEQRGRVFKQLVAEQKDWKAKQDE